MSAFTLLYEGKDITKDIEPILLYLEYTDSMDGRASSLDISLADYDKRWIDKWLPTVEDRMKLYINGTKQMDAKTFYIDEFDSTGFRNEIITNIRALSIAPSALYSAHTKKQYNGVAFSSVAGEIAGLFGLSVSGDVSGTVYANCAGNKIEFLAKQAHRLNKVMKIEDGVMYFYSIDNLRTATYYSVSANDCTRYSIRDKAQGRWKKCTCKWYDVKKKTTVSGSYSTGGKGSEAVIWQECKDSSDAESQAKSWIEQKQKQCVEVELAMLGDVRMRAGAMLMVKDLGAYSGKYIIDEAKHRITRMEGHTTTIKLRK